MNSSELATETEILRLCYLCDIVDGAAIVNWADTKIGDGFHEVNELLDISTVKMTHMDYLSKLKTVSTGCDPFTALRIACAKLCGFLESDIKAMPFFLEMLHESVSANGNKMPEDLSFLTGADADTNSAQLLEGFKKLKAAYGHLFPKDIQVKII